jgi:flagellar biogenesis protein FliO
MTIFDAIVEANQHAKEQIALDAWEPRLISGLLLRMMIALIALACWRIKRLQQFANGLSKYRW